MPARLTHAEYVARLQAVHKGRLTALSTYSNQVTRIRHRCNVCDHVWSPVPVDVMTHGSGCPLCANRRLGQSKKKSHKQYVQELKAINPNIRPLEKYVKYSVKLLHECLVCTRRWSINPNNTLFGHGCPDCKANDASIRESTFGSRDSYKTYKCGKRVVRVQGFEPQALDWLRSRGVRLSKLCFSTSEGKPIIPYKRDGKLRRYVPDFFHPGLNRIIEVKSIFTLGLLGQPEFYRVVKKKAKACLRAGYSFSLLVMNRDSTRMKLPKNWYDYSYDELRDYLHIR